jgi:hypothetical protein
MNWKTISALGICRQLRIRCGRLLSMLLLQVVAKQLNKYFHLEFPCQFVIHLFLCKLQMLSNAMLEDLLRQLIIFCYFS